MNKRSAWARVFPFLNWIPHINAKTAQADLLAGITGAIIVLPQGLAFALIAGLPPEYGLFTAMITPLVAALFGSSWHLVSGPTTAISLVVFASVSKYAPPGNAEFIQLAITQCFLAGIFQLLLGLLRAGKLVKYVSQTVIVGFTAGAAILIISSQLPHILGLELPNGLGFFASWQHLVLSLEGLNYWVLLVGLGTWVIAIVIRRFGPNLPYMLLAMILGSLLNIAIGGVERGVPLVGKINASLPVFALPNLDAGNLKLLWGDALAIALLGLIQSVAIARAIALQSKQSLNANQEFIGQGLSNIAGSLFSCYVGAGSFTRSGINHQSGGKTPLAAIFSSVVLMILVLMFASFTAYLPLPSMGAIVLIVGVNLIDLDYIKHILNANRVEVIVFLVTFLATIFFNLQFAIYFGVLSSFILYLYRRVRGK
ncbi:MAG: SulP family inorganic anion transporter [Bacteroidota bacterium]